MKHSAKLIFVTLVILSAHSLFGGILLSQNGKQFTFQVLPGQSTPLSSGFASYDSGNIGGFHGIFFTGAQSAQAVNTVITNTLFDDTGAAIPDNLVNKLMTDGTNNTEGVVVGFGNQNGFDSSNSFTVAGGTLTLEAFSFSDFTLPASPITGMDFDTVFDSGTTGVSAGLTPTAIPEPAPVVMVFFGLGMVWFFHRKRRGH